MKITGTVKLEATVDAGGKVTAVKTVSGSRALSPRRRRSREQVEICPRRLASATVEVEVTFSLGQ